MLAVAGNFIDHAHTTAANYGLGTIAFYGSPNTPRTVSIGHALINNFRIGDNGADLGGLPANAASTGNIVLARDLVTTGSFLVRGGSSVDVGNHLLSVGALTLNTGANLRLTVAGLDAGVDLGQVIASGPISLDGANLILDVLGPLNDFSYGDVITLIDNTSAGSITGTFSGLPEGATVYVSGRPFATVSYVGGTGNDLTLTVLPEPGAMAMLALGGLAAVYDRRRRLRR